MSGGPPAELLHRQFQIITLAMAAGVLIFGAVVVGLGLADMAGTGSVDRPVRLIAALLGVVLLVAAQFLGPALSRAPRGAERSEVAQRLQSGFLAGQALREAVGLAGVVAGYLTGDHLLMGALIAVSVVSMLVAIPGRDALASRLGRP